MVVHHERLKQDESFNHWPPSFFRPEKLTSGFLVEELLDITEEGLDECLSLLNSAPVMP